MFVLFPALFIAATVGGQTKQNILQETCIASALINNVTNYLFVYTTCRTLICTRDPSAKERARTPESAKRSRRKTQEKRADASSENSIGVRLIVLGPFTCLLLYGVDLFPTAQHAEGSGRIESSVPPGRNRGIERYVFAPHAKSFARSAGASPHTILLGIA